MMCIKGEQSRRDAKLSLNDVNFLFAWCKRTGESPKKGCGCQTPPATSNCKPYFKQQFVPIRILLAKVHWRW